MSEKIVQLNEEVIKGQIKVYADRINEKPRMNRDGTGRYEKTRYFSGKRDIFNRDRAASGPFLSDNLRRGRRRGRRPFFMPRTAHEGPRTAGGPLDVHEAQEAGNP